MKTKQLFNTILDRFAPGYSQKTGASSEGGGDDAAQLEEEVRDPPLHVKTKGKYSLRGVKSPVPPESSPPSSTPLAAAPPIPEHLQGLDLVYLVDENGLLVPRAVKREADLSKFLESPNLSVTKKLGRGKGRGGGGGGAGGGGSGAGGGGKVVTAAKKPPSKAAPKASRQDKGQGSKGGLLLGESSTTPTEEDFFNKHEDIRIDTTDESTLLNCQDFGFVGRVSRTSKPASKQGSSP